MEDVTWGIHCRLWQWCLTIFVLLLVQSNLYAATQGSVGSTSSHGSISITLEIPQITRISAEFEQLSTSEQTQLCLNVSGNDNDTAVNFFTVAGLDGDIPADYNIGLSDYQQSAQVIKLSEFDASRCNFQSNITRSEHISGSQALLLMMIAE